MVSNYQCKSIQSGLLANLNATTSSISVKNAVEDVPNLHLCILLQDASEQSLPVIGITCTLVPSMAYFGFTNAGFAY